MNIKNYYYKVSQIRVALKYSENDVKNAIINHCKIKKNQLQSFKLLKRSLDARKKAVYTMTAEVTTNTEIKYFSRDIQKIDPPKKLPDIPLIKTEKKPPVIIGAGPAGLWAAWYLAKAGLKPILIERGEEVLQRNKTVTSFWIKGTLNTESNVLFGEGGAGLFSDGKLTARSKDKIRVKRFLNLLVSHGASNNILIDTHPHIGSDDLMKIVPSIREEIKLLGGTVHFNTKLKKINSQNNQITSIETSQGNILSNNLILATGHSARDIYYNLAEMKVKLQNKPFALGVRLELSQELIDLNRHRKNKDLLEPASFRLTRKAEKGTRACYTFCMCPGGQVISCAHEPGMITSNGMSYSKRSMPYGNAAFLVPVNEEDHSHLKSSFELTGIALQELLEKKTFIAGGRDYSLPASDLASFLNSSKPFKIPKAYSSHRVKPADINTILPNFITSTLHQSIEPMLSQLGSPDPSKITIYGSESRSSSPVQIVRDKKGESVSLKGLFPAGEGSGYTGGIVSSGVDGLKAAESIINNYK